MSGTFAGHCRVMGRLATFFRMVRRPDCSSLYIRPYYTIFRLDMLYV